MMPPLDLRLYGVLDPARSRGRDPAALAAAAAKGGITLLQLRDKTSGTRDLVALARAVKAALEPHGVPLLVNDRVDVALAAGAKGVHVGRTDMAPEDARRLLGPEALIGITVHHAHEAATVPPGIADYAGLGPVHATASKDPGDSPLGPEGLARLIQGVRQYLSGLPVCGIAGIDHENAAAVIAAGADGVAVISDIFMADDVEAAARRLRAVVDRALAGRRP
jgi:thiamine-phosphate pyrophosphorylase